MTMMQGRTERTTTQLAPAPINLDQRLDWQHAALYGALLMVGAAFVALGGALFGWGISTRMEWRTSGQWIATGAGGAVLAGGSLASLIALWLIGSLAMYERQARKMWTMQLLSERQTQGGLIIEEERSEWGLRIDDPRHLLLVAIYVHLSVRSGERWAWSNDNLAGSIYLDTGDKSRLIGKLSEHEARKFGSEFERIGLVRNRARKAAGEWTAQTTDDVVNAVLRGLR